nr:50S ribosomal protein L15P [uncultured archaeon]
MTTNRRKKDTGQRGSHTHGWGSKKKHRGSGNRGGKGMAGTGKRADTKKPSIWKERYFGKRGFTPKYAVHLRSVNVETIDETVEMLASQKLAKAENGAYDIDLSQIGFDKLLGKGRVTRKLIIKVKYASARAVEVVKAAGGEVSTPEAKD